MKQLQRSPAGYPEELIRRYVRAAWFGEGESCYHEILDWLFKKVYAPRIRELIP